MQQMATRLAKGFDHRVCGKVVERAGARREGEGCGVVETQKGGSRIRRSEVLDMRRKAASKVKRSMSSKSLRSARVACGSRMTAGASCK